MTSQMLTRMQPAKVLKNIMNRSREEEVEEATYLRSAQAVDHAP